MAVAANYAGIFQRFISLFIDGLIIGVVNIALGFVLGSLGSGGASLAQGIGVLISLGYEVYFLTSTGQTPGMKVMNIKIVTASGELLSMGQAVVRVVVAYFSGLVLLLGYLWAFWDANKQTWHDKAATSFVVRV